MTGDHNKILATKDETIWNPATRATMSMVVEYRADGCVTWRQA